MHLGGWALRGRGWGGIPVRALSREFAAYGWAPSTAEIARLAGIDSVRVLRYDGNVPAVPNAAARPGVLAGALTRVNEYPHGGYTELVPAIASYAGVHPESVVLGAGADDLILLVGRSFAGPGDEVAITPMPTYPMYRVAAHLAGAEVGAAAPALTFTAARTTRAATSASCRRRGRWSWTRRTTSTRASRRSTGSTRRTSSSSAPSRRRSAWPARVSATRWPAPRSRPS